MLHGKKIVVVFRPLREETLKKTFDEIPREIVDHCILVDDASDDKTVELAQQLGILTFVHKQNLGYGANQKTCYREALKLGADIVVMVHPDYQYDPRLITAMAAMLASGIYDVVLGSRILGKTALQGGMPVYKYVFNRCLTVIQNVLLGAKLSEYHTGYRAFTRRVLETLPLLACSDDFVFDNQMLTQCVALIFRLARFRARPSTLRKPVRSTFVGASFTAWGCWQRVCAYRLWKWGLIKTSLFNESRTTLRINSGYYYDANREKQEGEYPAVVSRDPKD